MTLKFQKAINIVGNILREALENPMAEVQPIKYRLLSLQNMQV